MKGYDLTARKVVAQMGQRTIGLSGDLLSCPEVIERLEELAFGDTIEPNTPFEKIYFSPLPGNKWVIGRGVRAMDSAGRGAFFFHHLVVDEADIIKLNANPMVIFKQFSFFEKEADLPDSRLIPPTEIDISPGDCEFPGIDGSNKAEIENLLAGILAEKSGQPVWVILERGEERDFIEKLLGLLPFNQRKQLGFSTDFYNSYNIQHHFRLVFVNSEEEIPYKNCTIYNFIDRVFPGQPAGKGTYLKTIAELSPLEVKTLVKDLGELQIHHENIQRSSDCREIIGTNIKKRKQSLPVFYEVAPIETAAVILGGGEPGVEPDYRLFCDFYGNFIARIEPRWFIELYSPVPEKIFFALSRLIESAPHDTSFKKKVFIAVYRHLETIGSGEILNSLVLRFPGLSMDMLDYFGEELPRMYHLVRLPGLEKDIRIQLTRLIYDIMLTETREENFHGLIPVIEFLDGMEIDTQPLKIIVQLQSIRETRDFPKEGIDRYRVGEEDYRQLLDIGIHIVHDNGVSLKKMCDYFYSSEHKNIFVRMWVEFIRQPEITIKPIKLLIYLEAKDWIDPELRKLIFAYLGEGLLELSYIKKYRNYLKKREKDLPEYERIWKELEDSAPRGLIGSLIGTFKRLTGIKKEEKKGDSQS